MNLFNTRIVIIIFFIFNVLFSNYLMADLNIKWKSKNNRNHELVGRIFDVRNEVFISYGELLEKLNYENYILIGEIHKNHDHHQLEVMLISDLVSKDSSVIFEVLDDSQDENIADVVKTDSISEMKEKLKWNDKWIFRDYGYVIKQALKNDGVIVSGNITHSKVMNIYKHGLNEKINVPRKKVSDVIYETHCKEISGERLEKMTDIQVYRDHKMANAMMESKTNKKILVAGSGHVRKDFGVPYHLLNENIDSISLRLMVVDSGIQSLDSYYFMKNSIYDYIIFTPNHSDFEYCTEKYKK